MFPVDFSIMITADTDLSEASIFPSFNGLYHDQLLLHFMRDRQPGETCRRGRRGTKRSLTRQHLSVASVLWDSEPVMGISWDRAFQQLSIPR